MWRANGGAYAGTWDVNVTGGASGSGVATVDANGIITGSATVGGVVTTLGGVVTGTGTVVVTWTVNTVTALASGPANGTITGSVASGSWQDDTGGSGTWTATKQ
jgi:hypothetical protein